MDCCAAVSEASAAMAASRVGLRVKGQGLRVKGLGFIDLFLRKPSAINRNNYSTQYEP